MSVELLPSILSADFANLEREVQAAERGGGTVIHVDVMDGHFVPNITLGPPVVKSLRRATRLPLDCHLMIENPEQWAIGYAEAGAVNVTFHAEAASEPEQLAGRLRAAGAMAGLALDPDTALDPVLPLLPAFDTLLLMTVKSGFGGQSFRTDVLPKIRSARRHIRSGHLRLVVEVDGGIDVTTIAAAAEAGADMFVAGSSVYGASDPARAVEALREAARAAMTGASSPE